ncbi:MAG: DUF1501 domain-containing protein [Planctomycetota bacterium]|nr:MAG: DUF1501 domain-containing protein [Planctomycetota bacterium]REK26162.1 MAG: DUF1501 domain-containing protein [Planctomycetota bacterium]REK33531.1 MAG: DUF1501 domain-containing protein [Planctomycetota bacterium]
MLNLLPTRFQDCERVSRRSLLQVGALGGLGITLPGFLAARQAAAAHGQASIDRNCILIWTRGGTSHHDTFDPKPNAPASVKGEFGVIDTAVPGVQFTEIVPNMARELRRFAVLRSWNPQNGSHGTADQYVMSGRKFNAALPYPTYGSVVSWHKGFKTALPPFVQLGTNVDQRFGGGTAGILGLEHNPFEIVADPNAENFTVRDISPPKTVPGQRIDRRRKMLAAIDDLQQQADLQPTAFEALDETFGAALNMITAPETKQAFELSAESDALRDSYGRNRFGQSCLLARRLVESGVRFVTVTDGGWDTHQNNFKSLRESRIPPVDQGLPALLADLEDRGMLDSTLVVWLTDFGRTPKINSASGRDHWASAGFAVMAGAGVPGGAILGETDDEGGKPIRDEYKTQDIAVTVYEKLGMPHDLIAQAPDGRPVRLIEGHPIKEWM